MLGRRGLALFAATVVVASGVGMVIALAGHRDEPSVKVGFALGSVFVGVALALVGALVLGLRPANSLGPLLFVMGASMVAQFALREYAFTGLRADPGSVPAPAVGAWLGLALDPLFFPVPLALVLLLFPDGRLPSRWWRPLIVLGFALVAARLALLILRPGPLTDESYGYEVRWVGVLPASSLGMATRTDGVLTALSLLMLVVAAVTLVIRYVRAGSDHRRRLTPLAIVAAAAVAGLVIQGWPVSEALGRTVLVGAVVLGLPAALAIGALKYRVWELDRVIVSSIVYGGLALTIGAGYVAVVVALAGLAGVRQDAPALLPSVLAAAVVAVVFGPLKDRLTGAARRLVYGIRATPYEALAALPRQLADVPAVDDVLPGTAAALVRGLGVVSARVRVFLEDGAERTAWSPSGSRAESSQAEPAMICVPVRHLGVLVGDVAVQPWPDRPLRSSDHRLLSDLAAQSGPALQGVALTMQLEARLDEITRQSEDLKASRQRIAAAQVEERRRIERDIHDGAQQQLVALAVRLQQAENLATPGSDASQAVADCRVALDQCINDLRQLVSGIYPPVLAVRGLAAAVRARARMADNVRLTIDPVLNGARLPVSVEVSAYFCTLEAMQNAAKHAAGSAVDVHLRIEGGELTLTVTDHGPGFDVTAARESHGSGLIGMQDRLAAADGTLEVESTPGVGSTIRARIPLALVPAGR